MKIEEKIMRILDDYKEPFNHGSDGESDTFFAISEDEFGYIAEELLKILKSK